MDSRHFNELLSLTYERLLDLSDTKGIEYAGSQDRLANFKRLGVELGLRPQKVLWVYLTKHLDSIRTYLRELDVKQSRPLSEPIEGRIDDAILYLVLLKGLIQDDKEGSRLPAPSHKQAKVGGISSPGPLRPEQPQHPGLGGIGFQPSLADGVEVAKQDPGADKHPVWVNIVPDQGAGEVAN